MRLTFKPFDGRGHNSRRVINEDTGTEVGFIRSNGVGFSYGGGGIEISLFGDRYCATVSTYNECCGFVKGVEAVLRQMTSTRHIIQTVETHAATQAA
jgi:hypothetical protein